MKIDTQHELFDTAQLALGRMSEEQDVTELSEDLFMFNGDCTRAVCILDDMGKGGNGYKFVVMGAYHITDGLWVATYFNDEFQDAIDAMNDANAYLKRDDQEDDKEQE